MPRAILHLGMPRTGSTTLQHIWLRHRDALAGRGILYPDLTPPGAAPHINHQHLGEALNRRAAAAPLEELLGQLDRALRGDAGTLILSYEMWAHRRPQALAPMLDRLRRAGAAIAPLVVVKSAAEAANSAYTLRLLFLSEARDFAAYARSLGLRFRLDLPARLLPWRAACGGMTALPLRDLAEDAPLVARAWRAAGIAPRAGDLLDAADLARRENPSPGPVVIEACRRLAATGLRRGRGDDAMRAITRAIEAAAAARGADAAPFRGHDAAIAAALEARWARRQDRFAEAVWGRAWSARVAPPLPGEANELARTGDPEGLRLVGEVLAEVCPRFGLPIPGPPPRGVFAGWRGLLPIPFRSKGAR